MADTSELDRLLIAGLSADGLSECYKVFDRTFEQVQEYTIDISEERAELASVLASLRPGQAPPFGLDSYQAMTGYLLHPHSFVQMGSRVLVAMRQSQYARLLSLENGIIVGDQRWAPAVEAEPSYVLSGTNSAAANNGIWLARSSITERWSNHPEGRHHFAGEISLFDESLDKVVSYATPPIVMDSIHQVTASGSRYVIGVDMNLEADISEETLLAVDLPYPQDEDERGILRRFANEPFHASSGFLVDLETGIAATFSPRHHTSAHVELDPIDPQVFYVSCHNMTKWRRQLVLRGPAAVYRYRYDGSKVHEDGLFTAPNFFRATSQVLFVDTDGQSRLAVTNYPGSVFVVHAETMAVESEIELLPTQTHVAPFIVSKDESAPIFLAYDPPTHSLISSSGTHLYVIDLETRRVVRSQEFAEVGTFGATAHIGFMSGEYNR